MHVLGLANSASQAQHNLLGGLRLQDVGSKQPATSATWHGQHEVQMLQPGAPTASAAAVMLAQQPAVMLPQQQAIQLIACCSGVTPCCCIDCCCIDCCFCSSGQLQELLPHRQCTQLASH
jgi:hypothetical protein